MDITQTEQGHPDGPTGLEEKTSGTSVKTLGHLRLRHAETNEIILVPTPSSDPRDPLNW
jgi:hypothetical protein